MFIFQGERPPHIPGISIYPLAIPCKAKLKTEATPTCPKYQCLGLGLEAAPVYMNPFCFMTCSVRMELSAKYTSSSEKNQYTVITAPIGFLLLVCQVLTCTKSDCICKYMTEYARTIFIIISLFWIIWTFFDTRMEPSAKPWISIRDKAPFVRKGDYYKWSLIPNGTLSRMEPYLGR